MSKKQETKKGKLPEIELSPEESRELEMILDRLAVQSPEGESLEGYVRSLCKALIGREELVAALVDNLARSPSEVGFRAFSALQDLPGAKKTRRIVRQAAYRFEQKGFSRVPEPLKQSIVLVQGETRESVAHFAPVREAFWLVTALVQEPAHNEFLALTAYPEVDFNRISIKVIHTPHRRYREYIQKIGDNLSRKPVEVPLWHAARLFWDLAEFSRGVDRSKDMDLAKALLRPYYDPHRLPYAHELMQEDEATRQGFAEDDREDLLDHVPYSWLFPPKERLLTYWRKMNDVSSSVLIVSPQIQEERSREVLGMAADELCAGKARTLWQRAFEESALWLKLSGRHDLALRAWSVARHLAGESRVSENSVCMKIMGTAFYFYWPEDFEQAGDVNGSYSRTDSGLIIP